MAVAETTTTIGSAIHRVQIHAMAAETTPALQQAVSAAAAREAGLDQAAERLATPVQVAEPLVTPNLVVVWRAADVTERAVADTALAVAEDAESHERDSNYQVACSTRPGAESAVCSARFTAV